MEARVENLFHTDEFGISIFNYEVLEQLTSLKVVDYLRESNLEYNFFKADVIISNFIGISFIKVNRCYENNLQEAIKHQNCEVIRLSFSKGNNPSDDHFSIDEIYLGSLNKLGLETILKAGK